jgi:hypothetical protein
MDDLSDPLTAVGVAHVMGELVVDDFAAIAVLTTGGSKVHAH